MGWGEMMTALSEARSTIARADSMAAEMADIIAGRLQKAGVRQSTLRRLKNELRNYNPHTGKWKHP